MKYFLHDTTSLNTELSAKLISEYGFEGYGIYIAVLERIAFCESPIDKKTTIFILRLTKKHQKILNFCIEIGLILEQNEEIFEENIMENAKKYLIRKEKTKEKVKKFRANVKNNSSINQEVNENVTSYDTVSCLPCNQNVTTVNIIKDNINKEIYKETEISKPKKIKKPKIDVWSEEVETIYKLYPSTDINNKNRSTGKCANNKKQINTLINEKSFIAVKNSIETYINDCKKNSVFMKNFSTLLNNLPEVEVKDPKILQLSESTLAFMEKYPDKAKYFIKN